MTQDVKLTEYSHGAGCGCKISPAVLTQILESDKEYAVDPRLLVGNDTRDDAAVYALDDERLIISTTIFSCPSLITPRISADCFGQCHQRYLCNGRKAHYGHRYSRMAGQSTDTSIASRVMKAPEKHALAPALLLAGIPLTHRTDLRFGGHRNGAEEKLKAKRRCHGWVRAVFDQSTGRRLIHDGPKTRQTLG